MSLVTRAEQIYDLLTAVDSDEWLINLPFRLTLDPLVDMENGTEGTYIVPIVNEYDLGQSNKRGTVKQVAASPRVAVVIARPFAARDSAGIDVSTWAEAKLMLQYREQVELTILRGLPDLQAMEPEAPLETTFDKRWFMAVTEVTFNEVQC